LATAGSPDMIFLGIPRASTINEDMVIIESSCGCEVSKSEQKAIAESDLIGTDD
jgi:hypothetical protein